MSTSTGQVLAFPDIDVELSVVWGRRRVQIRDIQALAADLSQNGSAMAELDAFAQGPLELCVGEVTIGQARLIGVRPLRLEIVELFGQTGLVQDIDTPRDEMSPASQAD